MNQVLKTSLIALFAFFLLAVNDAGVKLASPGFSAFQIAAVVSVFSLLPMSAHIFTERLIQNPFPNRPGLMLLRSSMRVAATPAIFYAFATLPLVQVYIIIFTIPIATALSGSLFLKERIGRKKGLAILAGFLGVLVALNPSDISLEWGHAAAGILVVVAAIDAIIVRQTASNENIAVMNFWPTLNVALAMCFFAYPVYEPMTRETLTLLFGVSIFLWSGTLLMNISFRKGPVLAATPMQYSQIIWASLFGYFLFSEPFSAFTAAGALIIIASGTYLLLNSTEQPAFPENEESTSPS